MASRELDMQAVRTPEERFGGLADCPWSPRYRDWQIVEPFLRRVAAAS